MAKNEKYLEVKEQLIEALKKPDKNQDDANVISVLKR